ncbi:B3 DNA binding domain [Dillenia turbinata]|uniref:B3 DNA binding domain n=1 Tax=Dillenia turbinata TaxID=194707 RepID=A0AAN8Z9Q6_9MAGN
MPGVEGSPQFFKIFIPSLTSDQLKIPPGFIKHLEGKTSGICKLKGPSGNTWQVGLAQKDNGLVFKKGWGAFIKDHCSEFADLFVFRYDGDLNFTVQIFDASACEKESAFSAHFSNDIADLSEADENGPNEVNGEPLGMNCVNMLANVVEISDDEDFFHEPKLPMISSELGFRKARANKRMRVVDEERENLAPSEKSGSEDDVADQSGSSKAQASKLDSIIASFGTNVPYFIHRMKIYNVKRARVLNLPIGFSRKCSLERTRPRSIVTLTNMEGDSWDIRVICRGSQVSLSQGWGNFVVDNGIEEGDTCIFRFAGPCKLQVYTIGKAEIQQVTGHKPFASASRAVESFLLCGVQI